MPVLELLNNLHPLFISKVRNEYVRTLLDTGATVSVWRGNPAILHRAGAIPVIEKYSMNTLAGKATGKLYKVSYDIGSLHFPDMPLEQRS